MVSNKGRNAETMPKTQKTMFLPDELCQLVQKYADNTGSNFSRVAAAAILQYFFNSKNGPNPVWMTLAVSLEKGGLSLDAIPKAMFEHYIRNAEARIAQLKASDPSHPGSIHKETIESCRSEMALWEHLIATCGGGLPGVITATADVLPTFAATGKAPLPDGTIVTRGAPVPVNLNAVTKEPDRKERNE